MDPLLRFARRVRRRIDAQRLLDRAAAGGLLGATVALAICSAVLARPDWSSDRLPAICAAAFALPIVASLVVVFWRPTTLSAASLAADARLRLRERLSTALSLSDADRATGAGEAVVADAAAKLAPYRPRDAYPLYVPRRLLLTPALAALVAVLLTRTAPPADVDPTSPNTIAVAPVPDPAKPPSPESRPAAAAQLASVTQSPRLKELEAELDRLTRRPAAQQPGPAERLRDKLADATALDGKLREYQRQQLDKLGQLENALRQLPGADSPPAEPARPAEAMAQALRRGDLAEAKRQADELRKKAKAGGADSAQQAADDLAKLGGDLERLTRDRERADDLQKQIDRATAEGRDAETLQRELDELKQKGSAGSEQLRQLADAVEKARQAAEAGDLEKLAESVEGVARQMDGVEGELRDLDAAGQMLQRLREETETVRRQLAGAGRGPGQPQDAPNAQGAGQATGERPVNRDAATGSVDQKVSGLFDPRGKKSFAGSVAGPAFSKRSAADLGPAIRQAAQEAPQAADAQRLPRDAQDAVRDYFDNLGGR